LLTENTNEGKDDMKLETPPEERSLGELFSDLSRETSLLMRQEVELAKVETSQIIKQVLKDALPAIIGLLIAYGGLLGLIEAGIYGLGTVLPWWASSLIIGGGTLIIGLIITAIALNHLRKRDLKLHHTVNTLKEDVQWAKRQAK
jgi:hypothetical protein